MRTLALLMVLGCASASAQSKSGPRRGWLTGAGLMLAGGGAVALSLGAYNSAQAQSAGQAVRAYYANGAAPTSREAATVRWLQERSEGLGAQGLGLLLGGAAAVLVGITLVLLDGWVGGAPVVLTVHPTRAAVLVSGTF